MGSLSDRKLAYSVSDLRGLSFEYCVWRAVSSHHPQEVLLAKFSMYVHVCAQNWPKARFILLFHKVHCIRAYILTVIAIHS